MIPWSNNLDTLRSHLLEIEWRPWMSLMALPTPGRLDRLLGLTDPSEVKILAGTDVASLGFCSLCAGLCAGW